MKIKNLPKDIKKVAKKYVKSEFPNPKTRPSDLMCAFDWGATKEGSRYWSLVDSGEFLEAEELRNNSLEDVKSCCTMDWCHSDTISSKPFFLDEVLSITVNEPEVVDPIVEVVREKLRQRSAVGIKKYGTTLDRSDLSLEQWIEHATEEAMDLCLYLTKIKEQLKNK